MSEGVHDIMGPHDGRGWMCPLEATLGEGVHSMVIACVSWFERVKVGMVGLRTRESVGQHYERDKLVGWTTNEEVRGSTTSPETKMHLHTTHKGYEFMGNERFKDKYYGIYFG